MREILQLPAMVVVVFNKSSSNDYFFGQKGQSQKWSKPGMVAATRQHNARTSVSANRQNNESHRALVLLVTSLEGELGKAKRKP